ncbi:hypothetical protein CDIK_2891 [Cucumispora dikerogammari]|nr:hypothetical protein CDIK_2891 [Cucumispora dikerogammari]
MFSLISINGNLNNKILGGSFDRNLFLNFLEDYHEKKLFLGSLVLIMNNVKFHHCAGIKIFLLENNIICICLLPYLLNFNSIENFFACVKSRLNEIRPRATENN